MPPACPPVPINKSGTLGALWCGARRGGKGGEGREQGGVDVKKEKQLCVLEMEGGEGGDEKKRFWGEEE